MISLRRLAAYAVVAALAAARPSVAAEPVQALDQAPLTQAPSGVLRAAAAARALAAAGQTARAIALLAPAVDADPDDAAGGRFLAGLYLLAGDRAASERTLEHVITVHPDDGIAHAQLGDLYVGDDRPDAAAFQYARATMTRHSYELYLAALARDGRLGEFIEKLEVQVQDHPFDTAAVAELGSVHLAMGQPELARDDYARVVARTPHDCTPLLALAAADLEVRRFDDAIGSVRACLAVAPRSYPANVILGEIELRAGRLDDAENAFQSAIAIDGAAAPAFDGLGDVAVRRGDLDQARTRYAAAVAADPLAPTSYAGLAVVALDDGDLEVAKQECDRALALDATDGRVHALLGDVYRARGDVADAQREYDAALRSPEPEVVSEAHDGLAALRLNPR